MTRRVPLHVRLDYMVRALGESACDIFGHVPHAYDPAYGEAACPHAGQAARIRPISSSAASVLRMNLVHIEPGTRLVTHRATLAD